MRTTAVATSLSFTRLLPTVSPQDLKGFMAARPVTRIVATHFHPDHIGLAGWWCERSGAELWASRTEWLQARALPRPDYQLLATRGEEHERIFDVRCMVPHAAVATEGTAASRRQAEQIAAEAALRLLEELRDDR